MELNPVQNSVESLMERGVKIPLPATVYIGPEVDIGRIAGDNVTLHPGTRIIGKNTLILPGTTLGEEAPVTVDNCYIGSDTRLKGGFFQDAAFAGKNSFGSGAHVRGGTILEEDASAAHTVGLKADHPLSLCHPGQPHKFLRSSHGRRYQSEKSFRGGQFLYSF